MPAFAPPPGVAPGEYRMQQVDVERSQEFRKCIECFLCQNTCHVVRDHEENKQAFAGPRFFIRAAELDMHPLDARTDRKQFAQRGAGPRHVQHHQVLHRGLPGAHQDHRQRDHPDEGARGRPTSTTRWSGSAARSSGGTSWPRSAAPSKQVGAPHPARTARCGTSTRRPRWTPRWARTGGWRSPRSPSTGPGAASPFGETRSTFPLPATTTDLPAPGPRTRDTRDRACSSASLRLAVDGSCRIGSAASAGP